MKWDDDLLLERSPPKRGELQLAMYALHVASGSSVTSAMVKLPTIKLYVAQVAKFLSLFCQRDLRRVNPGDPHLAPLLSGVYKDLEQFEKVPDRREPYTPEMHEEAERQVRPLRDTDPLCVYVVLVDFFEVGLSVGYRLAEWAQNAENPDPHFPALNHLKPPDILTRAFVQSDFRAQLGERPYKWYTGILLLVIPLERFRKVELTFRTQKNRVNGEKRVWTRNTTPGGHCMVSAVYRILTRFQKFLEMDPTLDPVTTPVSIYWDPVLCRVRSITSVDIEVFMRAVASTVYGLHPVKDAAALALWSSHSIRIGACVIMHALGFSDRDIQWTFRWRSLAFLAYLRNLAGLADRQNRAIDQARHMPHLF